MLRMGLITQCSSGVYSLLPVGFRALEKLISLIDKQMQTIGATKMVMPVIVPSSLWKTSGRHKCEVTGVYKFIRNLVSCIGRWEAAQQELFKLRDRDATQFCLGPVRTYVKLLCYHM